MRFHIPRRWRVFVVALIALGGVFSATAAQASSTGSFVNPEDQHFVASCGQFWPAIGEFDASQIGDSYSATMKFTFTDQQLKSLDCVDLFLELDFRIKGFQVPPQWDGYNVTGTNLPYAIHDVATSDFSTTESTPGVTGIQVSMLKPDVEYYATIAWSLPISGTPQVAFDLVPSHWASSAAELGFCGPASAYSLAECIFGTTRSYLSRGYLGSEDAQYITLSGTQVRQFGQAPPPQSQPNPGPAIYQHMVYHTCANGACGLRFHPTPDYNDQTITRVLNDGDAVGIICQTQGPAVTGLDGSSSTVWDKTDQGDYAADFHIDTDGMNGAYSPPIPVC